MARELRIFFTVFKWLGDSNAGFCVVTRGNRVQLLSRRGHTPQSLSVAMCVGPDCTHEM